MSERTFRYVVQWRRSAYEAIGWVYSADLGITHGQYSCLMEWMGEGEPVEPGSVDCVAADARQALLRRAA
jgi:hypothetical protein